MMYQGKHGNANARKGRKRLFKHGRMAAMVLSMLLLLALAIGGTVAWLTADTGEVANTFTPSHVACEVTENFDGTTKSNVNVINTGDTEAYIRVKLVTYRVNNAGQHIGGTAEIPTFTLGENWVENGGYYYYTKPVERGQSPAENLTDSMTLTGSYDDADGGKQVIEVMAEAIQAKGVDSTGTPAVKLAWGVSVDADSKLDIN